MTDTPTDGDIHSLLAQALPFLSHTGEIEYVTSYLVTGEVPPVSLLIGRPYKASGDLSVGMHCTGLILWARYGGRQTAYDFYTQVHLTQRYYALKRELELLNHETLS